MAGAGLALSCLRALRRSQRGCRLDITAKHKHILHRQSNIACRSPCPCMLYFYVQRPSPSRLASTPAHRPPKLLLFVALLSCPSALRRPISDSCSRASTSPSPDPSHTLESTYAPARRTDVPAALLPVSLPASAFPRLLLATPARRRPRRRSWLPTRPRHAALLRQGPLGSCAALHAACHAQRRA